MSKNLPALRSRGAIASRERSAPIQSRGDALATARAERRALAAARAEQRAEISRRAASAANALQACAAGPVAPRQADVARLVAVDRVAVARHADSARLVAVDRALAVFAVAAATALNPQPAPTESGAGDE
ncbi:MAG: hypothetical protein MUF70_16720 [Myxococcota bacterium]|nr:hypothetical protein [Myxococcota bacterium]